MRWKLVVYKLNTVNSGYLIMLLTKHSSVGEDAFFHNYAGFLLDITEIFIMNVYTEIIVMAYRI